MSKLFEELDYSQTPLGPLSLRRRRELSLGVDIFEVILGEHHLMSSLFTASEVALGRLGIDAAPAGDLDVVVGGLGLGYTAQAVLEFNRVRSLKVVEILQPVIEWHKRGLLPIDPPLQNDPRCQFVLADFFALAASGDGFGAAASGDKYHAILLDIDHSPEFHLDEKNSAFYSDKGLQQLKCHLRPGGIFALWSNELSDAKFMTTLQKTFSGVTAEKVEFHNPLQNRPFVQTVYLARV